MWYVSVKVSVFLSQTVYVCHRQFMSVTENLYPLENVWACLRQYLCVCHRQSVVCVTVTLCLSQIIYQALFLIILGLIFTWLYVIFIKIFQWDFSLSGTSEPMEPILWNNNKAVRPTTTPATSEATSGGVLIRTKDKLHKKWEAR